MSEFTGERVIPGQVNDDLWAEHVARYALAARLAPGRRVLDLGCGAGYGTADLARVASAAVGVDLAPDAIAYASHHFPSARFLPQFIQCSATAVPFPPASFDLVTAFEVIEHLRDWRALIGRSAARAPPGRPADRVDAQQALLRGSQSQVRSESISRARVRIRRVPRRSAGVLPACAGPVSRPCRSVCVLRRELDYQRRSRPRAPVRRSGKCELLHRLLLLQSPAAASRLSLRSPSRQSAERTRGTHSTAGAGTRAGPHMAGPNHGGSQRTAERAFRSAGARPLKSSPI